MEDGSDSVAQSTTRALGHPVRTDLLRLLSSRHTLSAKQAMGFSILATLSLSQVNYHLRLLDQDGFVEPAAGLSQPDGLPFRFTDKGRQALTMIGEPSTD